MKEFFTYIALLFTGLFQAPVAELQPAGIFPVPDISKSEYNALLEKMDKGLVGEEEAKSYYASPIFLHFYSNACSWYCSGVIDSIVASSSQKGFEVEKIHDFDHETAWVVATHHHRQDSERICQICAGVAGVRPHQATETLPQQQTSRHTRIGG